MAHCFDAREKGGMIVIRVSSMRFSAEIEHLPYQLKLIEVNYYMVKMKTS
jgi:hypothetical protein